MSEGQEAIDGDATVPRVVWMYWGQGWDAAPALVRFCAESWRRLNPTWDVRLLDASSVEDYVARRIPQDRWERMEPAHRAAHLRLELLAAHGGVWADATCLVFQPLDAWLPAVTRSGFFAFRWLPSDVLRYADGRPDREAGRNRRMASWFLAASPDNVLLRRLADAFTAYWRDARFDDEPLGPGRKIARRAMYAITRRHASLASWWAHPLATRVLRVRPYLVVNAVFTRLVQSDAACRSVWRRTPTVSARHAHRLHEVGLDPRLTEQALREGAGRLAPLQKLDRRMVFDEDVERVLREALDARVRSGPGAEAARSPA